MKGHHSFAAGMASGFFVAGQPLLLIGLGVIIGLALAQVSALAKWLGRRFAKAT